MDLKDWHKRLDLEAKLTKRAQDRAAAPPKLFPSRPEAPAADNGHVPENGHGNGHGNSPKAAEVVETSPLSLPPRKGRGPRKEESREQLIARLLDPTLTLEETARILEVCPTTVRRWTNKGVLPCERSAGNQRRFKLSSIQTFLQRRDEPEPLRNGE